MGQAHEEGLQDIWEQYWATPGDFYIGLCSDSVIPKGSVFTDLTEVTGSGYAKIALSTITVGVRGTDDRKATGNQVTFVATGNWTQAVSWFLVRDDVTSGTYKLLFTNALTVAVTLSNGEDVSVIPVFNANG